MCFGSDDPAPAQKKPVSPLATTPMPDQGAPDVVAARVRERQQLDAMAGYRSTFVSGPRGPGGPTLADQRAQLDVTSALPASDPNAATVAPPPAPIGTPSGGAGGKGGGPVGGGGEGGAPGGSGKSKLTVDDGSGGITTPSGTPWWAPKKKVGFYDQ
jgi:hypothetical protein